jgi:Family of unknown function (DUF5343)
MAALPYVTTPGNIEKALQNIKAAATPQNVNQDFVKTILKIPGGSGNQMAAFLRKVGFVRPDGSPSDIYRSFRNDATTGSASAEALKIGYAPLTLRNEYWYAMTDEKLRGLIVEETGSAKDATMVGMILACIKAIKKHADFNIKSEQATAPSAAPATPTPPAHYVPPQLHAPEIQSMGLRLGYIINLNLPATSDIAVFNAIFKSLRENLLESTDEA